MKTQQQLDAEEAIIADLEYEMELDWLFADLAHYLAA